MSSNSYGPSTSSAPSFFDAPKLVPGQDRKRWRRDVLEWVSFTKDRAESGEKTAMANVRTMGYLLYHSLHTDYKAVLDHARDNGELVLAGGENQENAVKTIISLVGEDTPIDVTNRILASYQKLHACQRSDGEATSKFADRFRGLASEYMALAGISANGKDSQLIAMVLLQNAKLDENTSNAITIQLVAKAEARKRDALELQGNSVVKLSEATILDLKQKVEAAKNATDIVVQGNEAEAVPSIDHIRSIGEKIDIALDAIKGLVSVDSCSSGTPSNAPEIFLDDVHKALSTLKTTTTKQPSRMNVDLEKLTKKVNDFASMLGKRNPYGIGKGRPGSGEIGKEAQQARKSRLERLKARTKCNACGMKGHWAGDAECKGGDGKKDDEKDEEMEDEQDDAPTQHFPRRDQ